MYIIYKNTSFTKKKKIIINRSKILRSFFSFCVAQRFWMYNDFSFFLPRQNEKHVYDVPSKNYE